MTLEKKVETLEALCREQHALLLRLILDFGQRNYSVDPIEWMCASQALIAKLNADAESER